MKKLRIKLVKDEVIVEIGVECLLCEYVSSCIEKGVMNVRSYMLKELK